MPGDDFDIGLARNVSSLKARVIEGHNPLDQDSCILTDTVLSVQKLLGPLTRETVSTVRCIGGNYKSHRMLLALLLKLAMDVLVLIRDINSG